MKKSFSAVRFPLPVLFLLTLATYFTGCKKEFRDSDTISALVSKPAADGPIPPYLFNWETATNMPSTPANVIPMPWNSGTTAIDPSIVSDYKSADGWKMVWNTFSPTTSAINPQTTLFMALYNVYRGLLRFYLWQPPTAIATDYITHGLSLYTSSGTSSMLNFNAQDILTAGQNQASFSQVYNQAININGGTWYVLQYEIAYDPNIANTSFPNFGVTWASKYATVSSIALNGTLNGSITGTIGAQPASTDINFNNLLTNGVVTALGSAKYLSLGSSYKDAINSGLQNIVKGFFSGILGNSGQAVSLNINAEMKFTGNLVTNGGLENMKLVLPGQQNSQSADGNIPAYNNLMGVFNITTMPIVQIDESDNGSFQTTDPYDGSACTEAWINAKCWFDVNSVHILWNPAIINSSANGATINNLNIDLLTIEPSPGGTEKVGNYYVTSYRNPSASAPVTIHLNTQVCPAGGTAQPYVPQLLVRVSFDVVPNNGAPKTTIVKTYNTNQF